MLAPCRAIALRAPDVAWTYARVGALVLGLAWGVYDPSWGRVAAC